MLLIDGPSLSVKLKTMQQKGEHNINIKIRHSIHMVLLIFVSFEKYISENYLIPTIL